MFAIVGPRRFLWRLAFAEIAAIPMIEAVQAQTETVVVTASPPNPVGDAAFSAATLDSNALSNSTQLDESLEQVPGLSLFRRNSSLSANPSTQGVSLRSIGPSGAGRALVTLDGVPQNDPFGGWVIWSSLPSEDIASAEVVRGAGAGPYGAGALTGVIALDEQSGDGLAAADASWGQLQTGHAAAAGGATLGDVHVFASGALTSSAGWIPVDAQQRGAADDDVTLNARSGSLAALYAPFSGSVLALRLGVYDEHRDSGIVGTTSTASGTTASLTLATLQTAQSLRWRVQAWMRDTNFSNSSASIAPDRVSATPANDQYATPAIGWGANAALRGANDWLNWEIGADGRFANGESREHYLFASDAFTAGRISGGDSFVGGLYAEGASRLDNWLFTLGARADEWSTTDGHLVQATLYTGVITLDEHFPSRSGTVPTARGGVRYDFSSSFYVRSAAYEGFRAPTLNELYRPFRLGNTTTEANPALTPEELYGLEIGAGGTMSALTWSATVFFNQLHNAVTNVTLAPNLLQRQNAGDINAPGVEAEANYAVNDRLSLRAAFDLVDAHVDGGSQTPQLTGLRPSQAPRWTVTAGLDAVPLARLSFSAQLRFESTRFADDQNLLPLPAATTVDTKLSYAVAGNLSVYVAGDNLLNASIATTESSDGVVDYDEPRVLSVGVSLKG